MTSAVNLRQHIKEYFEGLSQVLFFKDAYFGAFLLLISIFFKPQLFLPAMAASLIGYFYSTLYRTPKILKALGLMTINGFFFGLAMANLFQSSLQFYFCLFIGALAIPLVTKACFEVLQHWKLNPLIAPYILTIWVLSLSGDGISLKTNDIGDLGYNSQLFQLLQISLPDIWQKFLFSLMNGMGQIFFLQNADYGLFLLLLITSFSPRRGFYFLIGTSLSTALFFLLAGHSQAWQMGLLSSCAGLVGLGLASMPEKFSLQTIFLFCLLSLFLTLAIDHLLKGFHLPALSLPYVLTFWFALLSRVPRLNVSWAPAEARH